MRLIARYIIVLSAIGFICIGYAKLKQQQRVSGQELLANIDSKIANAQITDDDCSKFLKFFRDGRRSVISDDKHIDSTLYIMLKKFPNELIEALVKAEKPVRRNVYAHIGRSAYIEDDITSIYAIVLMSQGDDNIKRHLLDSINDAMLGRRMDE